MLFKTYLKEHRKELYSTLMMEGKLVTYLNEVDDTANSRMELLIRQMQEKQGIDEKIKFQNQMKWVGLMNNIKASAEEIVLKDMVYDGFSLQCQKRDSITVFSFPVEEGIMMIAVYLFKQFIEIF